MDVTTPVKTIGEASCGDFRLFLRQEASAVIDCCERPSAVRKTLAFLTFDRLEVGRRGDLKDQLT
jgi:hypothetical protein